MLVIMEYSIAFLLFLTAIVTGLNLDPAHNNLTCTTSNNKVGVCVDESICNEAFTIITTGIIDESDYRTYKDTCLKNHLWCCTTEVTPPPEIGDAESDICVAPITDECPWCVLLFNTIHRKNTATFPYCLGALIGSRVIITASTCIKAAQRKTLYAQISNSADVGKNYTVIRRLIHPEYNTGSHAYDFGILVLEEDVTFKNKKPRGACLDFQASLEGVCVGYGFNSKGKITSTILEVVNKSCGIQGDTKDSACGYKDYKDRDAECIVNTGSPIICAKKGQERDGLYLLGVARNFCKSDDTVMLGGISHSKQWLETELATMKVTSAVYTKE